MLVPCIEYGVDNNNSVRHASELKRVKTIIYYFYFVLWHKIECLYKEEIDMDIWTHRSLNRCVASARTQFTSIQSTYYYYCYYY